MSSLHLYLYIYISFSISPDLYVRPFKPRILNFLMMGPSMSLFLCVALFALWVFFLIWKHILWFWTFSWIILLIFACLLFSFSLMEHPLFGFWTSRTVSLIFLSLLFFCLFIFLCYFLEEFWNYISLPNYWGFHLCYH